MLDHRAKLLEMALFLERRLDEELLIADDVGDEVAHSFASGSRRIVAELRRDIDQRPWAHVEVGNYLLRAVCGFRGHLEFRPWWGAAFWPDQQR